MKLNFRIESPASMFFKNRLHNIWLCISRMEMEFPKLRGATSFSLEFSTRPFTGSKRFTIDRLRSSIGGHQICNEDFRRILNLVGESKVVYVKVTVKNK